MGPQDPSVNTMHNCNNCDLDKTLQNFWLQEELSKANPVTKDEQECEEHFRKTYSQNSEGKFVLRLPFKGERPTKADGLSDSVYPAKKMLTKMESRSQSDPELENSLRGFLGEYEKLGHMACASPLNKSYDISEHYFLLHHGVWKLSSTTKKLRIAFNGSAQLRSGE